MNIQEGFYHGKIKAGTGKRKNRRCGCWRKMEDGVVGAYRKVEDGFVDKFLTHEGETVEDAKKRLHEEQAQRETEAKKIF